MKKNERAGFWAALEGSQRAPRPSGAQGDARNAVGHIAPASTSAATPPSAPVEAPAPTAPAAEPELRQEPRLNMSGVDDMATEPQWTAQNVEPTLAPAEAAVSPAVESSAAAFSQSSQSWSAYSTPNQSQAHVHQALNASVSGADLADSGDAPSAAPRPASARKPAMDKARQLAATCKDWVARVPASRLPTKQELRDQVRRASLREDGALMSPAVSRP